MSKHNDEVPDELLPSFLARHKKPEDLISHRESNRYH